VHQYALQRMNSRLGCGSARRGSGLRPSDVKALAWAARFYCRHEGKGSRLLVSMLQRGDVVTVGGDARGIH